MTSIQGELNMQAGELVLAPLTVTVADPREPIELSWWAREWLAAKRVRVWRVRPGELAGEVRTDALITPLFRLVAYAVGRMPIPCNVPLDSVEFHGASIAPNTRLMLRLDPSGLDGPAEIVVAVSVERPPGCFQPRAAA